MAVDIMFSVGDYDRDGDLVGSVKPAVYLHFGETRVKVCDTVADFPQVVEQMQRIDEELKGNYL